MKNTRDFLDKLLKKGDTVIVGCSSGPDSMCLLDVLQQYEINIICAHVNHNVRQESLIEYQYLENYCKEKEITFELLELEPITVNFESEARKKRYDFFESLYHKYHAKWIMTAHHGDDLIETILMRITRGSNLKGYAGIKLIDDRYVHPLLFMNKDMILKYCEQNKIKYFWDYTNDLDEHTRNRYRHNILPFLKQEQADIHQKYYEFSHELIEYDNFVKNYIKSKKIIAKNIIDLDILENESEFIQEKTIEILVDNIQKEYQFDVNKKHIEAIKDLTKNSQSNVSINLPGNFIARKAYNKLLIEKKRKVSSFEQIFDSYYEDNNFIISRVNECNDTSNYVLRLNSQEITMPISIVSREDGDYIYLKNLGKKKIKDIFIDSKVDLILRDEYPLVKDANNQILWIPGIKKSKFDKDKNEKYDIILLCERK